MPEDNYWQLLTKKVCPTNDTNSAERLYTKDGIKCLVRTVINDAYIRFSGSIFQ